MNHTHKSQPHIELDRDLPRSMSLNTLEAFLVHLLLPQALWILKINSTGKFLDHPLLRIKPPMMQKDELQGRQLEGTLKALLDMSEGHLDLQTIHLV